MPTCDGRIRPTIVPTRAPGTWSAGRSQVFDGLARPDSIPGAVAFAATAT